MRHHILLLLVVSISCTWTLGCKSFDWNKSVETDTSSEDEMPWWKKDDLPPVQSPSKIVAIWTSSVLNEQGAPPIRGLGGRVYFYDAKHQPVRVDGKLSVFLYDDTNRTAREKQEATKQVNFTPEEVATKYTPSEFGPSYSFWLPWDEVGGERAQLSVIPVFTSKAGEMLVGEQARYLLPGKKPAALAEDKPRPTGGVVAASYEDGEDNTIQLKSSTIKIPKSVQQRLRSSVRPLRDRSQSSIRRANLNQSGQATSTGTGQSSATMAMVPQQRNRKPAGSFGKRNAARQRDSLANGGVTGSQTSPSANADSPLLSADSQRDLRQAQALQSAQPTSARDPSLLDRARSLFDRSQ